MTSANEIKEIITICQRCGNKGIHKVFGCHQKIATIHTDRKGDEFWHEYNYYILECPICESVSFYRKSTYEYDELDDGGYQYTDEMLYPAKSYEEHGVPKDILNAFMSAKKTYLFDDSICALSLRRVIELICKNKKAIGSNLAEMVKDLIAKNIFPSTFEISLKHIREIGNKGAHDSRLSVSKMELHILLGIVNDIIYFLYTVPAKIKYLEEKTNNRYKRDKEIREQIENGERQLIDLSTDNAINEFMEAVRSKTGKDLYNYIESLPRKTEKELNKLK